MDSEEKDHLYYYLEAQNIDDSDPTKIQEIMSDLIRTSPLKWSKDGQFLSTYIKTNRKLSKQDIKKINSLSILVPTPEIRENLWILLNKVNESKLSNPTLYNDLLHNFPSYLRSPKLEHQIILDSKRTYPQDKFFRIASTQAKIARILLAFSRKNITIGYYQGFNFIAAIILKEIQDEENAFWIFCNLLENILPFNYYYYSVGALTDCLVIQRILNIYFSKLISHLKSIDEDDIVVSNNLMRWMLCLFTMFKNHRALVTLFDNIFLKGYIAVFKFIFAIVCIFKKEMMECKSMEELAILFKMIEGKEISRKVLSFYFNIKNFDKFDMNVIEDNRKLYFNEVMKKIKRKLEKQLMDDVERRNRTIFKPCNDFIIYKIDEKVKVKDNYFFEFEKGKNKTPAFQCRDDFLNLGEIIYRNKNGNKKKKERKSSVDYCINCYFLYSKEEQNKYYYKKMLIERSLNNSLMKDLYDKEKQSSSSHDIKVSDDNEKEFDIICNNIKYNKKDSMIKMINRGRSLSLNM